MNEFIQLIWASRNDKNSLEELRELRERLGDVISFADFELHELELRGRLTALLGAGINEDTADKISELSEEIRGLFSWKTLKVS